MTKSTGQAGLISSGFPPNFTIASLIAAKSTTAGTPVRSYKITLAGLNGISTPFGALTYQSRIFSMSFSLMVKSS